jgi:glycosyl transferase family 2
VIRRLRTIAARALDRRLGAVTSRLEELRVLLAREQLERREAHAEVRSAIESLRARIDGEIYGMLRSLAAEDAANRRGLFELRESPEYDLPFVEANPLVTVCVTGRGDRIDLLVERALPSALAQTYENIEVVVVGDAAGLQARQAIEGLRDDRIRFSDLTQRVVHPDPHRQWLTGAIMPRNEAHRQAKGRWIADLDDDDALRPDAIEHLLELARSERVEVAYGIVEMHEPGGRRSTIGGFPPTPLEPDWREPGLGWQPWQGSASTGAIFHTGLRLFGREHVAAALGIPGDFFRLERMVRAGVRFGMLEQITYDYYPSTLWDSQTSP